MNNLVDEFNQFQETFSGCIPDQKELEITVLQALCTYSREIDDSMKDLEKIEANLNNTVVYKIINI